MAMGIDTTNAMTQRVEREPVDDPDPAAAKPKFCILKGVYEQGDNTCEPTVRPILPKTLYANQQ